MASSLLNDLIAGGFSKLAGLKISGTVPVKQDVANEVLNELVQSWSEPSRPAPVKDSSGVPVTEFLKTVRKLQVRPEQDVIHIDFEIGV